MTHIASHPRAAARTRKATRPVHVPPDMPCAVSPVAGEWRQAVVLHADGSDLTVRLDGRSQPARLAFGCLVAVCEADIVAVLVQAEQAWVMQVLERVGGQDLCLRSHGALELRADSIRLHAHEALHLQAKQAALNCEQAQMVGRGLRVVSSTIKVIGSVLETVFDTVRHYSKQHQRTTDGVDRTRAQHLEMQAEQLMQLHATHTLIDGERLVKARGAQIHLG